jgi:predicted RNase H-like nuclease (RuvC/YqgF family)
LPVVFVAALIMPLLGGCIARTAVDVVTAPVRAAGQVIDWTTTSQDEADRSLGRRVREREAAIGRLERQRARAAERCSDGREDSCREAEELDGQISDLRNSPVE